MESIGAFKILEDRGYGRESVFKHANNLVQCAAKYGGVVFGGYVRDVIIPVKMLGKKLREVDFKDLDFWFTSQEAADAFVTETKLQPHQQDLYTPGMYPVNRNQHISILKDESYLICDVMVTDFYPVCDFSVNLASWDGSELKANEPYDIIAHLSKIYLTNEPPEPVTKIYTPEDIAAILQDKGMELFDIQELIKLCYSLIPPPIRRYTEEERATLTQFLIPHEFLPYNLAQIVGQIKCHRYDICIPFSRIVTDPKCCVFNDSLRRTVQMRIETFYEKFVKAHQNMGMF